jgi:hypothetical protein
MLAEVPKRVNGATFTRKSRDGAKSVRLNARSTFYFRNLRRFRIGRSGKRVL